MKKKAVTLIELLIVTILIFTFIITISVVQLFVHSNLISNGRRIQVQNEAQYVIEHMVKQSNLALGDAISVPVEVSSNIVTIYQRNEIPYDIRNNADLPVRYVYNFPNLVFGLETLSRKISQFDVTYVPGDNFFTLNITSCYAPLGLAKGSSILFCGDMENPSFNLETRIFMPQVSAN